jgi:hypothetical protein
MKDKQVTFAKHNIFYKMFFEKHAELLKSFIDLKFEDLGTGYFRLLTFYSSYSYYLRDGSLINEVIVNERSKLINDKEYNLLLGKSLNGSIYSTKDLLTRNELYYENLINIFEKFDDFCNKLAPDSIMPDLTSNVTEYERNVLFASYETFYENFFNFHAQISEMLNKFNILEFLNIYKSLMAFYYGYSYYVSKYVKSLINDKFSENWAIYNDPDLMTLIYKLLSGNIMHDEKKKLKTIQETLFVNLNKIFDLINNDLPKKNMMPKKKEKISVDTTGI